jgi:hypothetical protein
MLEHQLTLRHLTPSIPGSLAPEPSPWDRASATVHFAPANGLLPVLLVALLLLVLPLTLLSAALSSALSVP